MNFFRCINLISVFYKLNVFTNFFFILFYVIFDVFYVSYKHK